MSFLYPGFLWALWALAIPIIIHLFNFRKTTRVYFSNTRFLRQVKEVTTAKRKLKHYLILASRLLFLFFLVIVFAQPMIPAREQLGAHRNIVLYLDNSLSMSAQLADNTRALDAAVTFAREIVALFPPDTRYKLITNDFASFSNTYKTRPEVSDLLTQVRLSPVTRRAAEVLARIRQDSHMAEQEVFWISDFQQSTFGSVDDRADTTIRWHLVPLSPEMSNNIFIDSAYLDNPFAVGMERNSLRIRVRNDGKKEVDQLVLKLSVNNIQAATASVSIPAGGVQETSFDLTTGLTGFNKAHVSFNDFPVSFDNDFYLALNFTDKIRVLEIKPSAQPTPVERVFGNRTLFSYGGYPVGNVNYSRLDEADLVVVNGIDVIDEALSLALHEYMNNAGTLLFIPGTSPDVNSYRRLLGMPVTQVDQKEQQELDRPDFNNPFFENVFEERSPSITMPAARKLLEWGSDRSAILKFRNDQPFLSMFQQSGKVYVLASPLDEAYTTLAGNALFVPVMYKLASSSKTNASRLYYTLQENFITLQVDSLAGEESLRLAGEQEIIPSQRKAGDKVLLDLPRFSMTQGFYHVMMNRDTIDLLAFDLDKAESMMARYTTEDVKSQLGNGDHITVFEAGNTGAFSNEIKARYLGKPLWKYALMFALFFLLAEVLLIRFLK